jgi:uncharacterized protein YndB with AHSA1/START domain
MRSYRDAAFLSAVILAGALAPVARGADVSQIPTVRISVETDIAAPAAKVWEQFTRGKNLVVWSPVWKSSKNAAVNLTRAGDALEFTPPEAPGGRSVVTFLSPNRELRLAHDPRDGSYTCQSRITLTAQGTQTHVRFVEQYTDENMPQDRDATAAKVRAEIEEALATLKARAER